jgi:beta-lactam-binding protein with PASTA domain
VTEGNRSETEVRNFLTSEGLLNVITEPAFIPGAPKGVVVGQAPSPGTILCPRDLVTIKVTR